MLLDIKNLSASIGDNQILSGLDLSLNVGEIHAIMGPNGAGKSTLANILVGRDDYDISADALMFDGQDITDLEPEERAVAGMFLAFQYPVEIPGVSNKEFLRIGLNAIRKQRGQPELDMFEFAELAQQNVDQLNMSNELLDRSVNVGFSGGEKKKNDIFQMAMLEPKLAILDETDSGLDIDALRIVADGVNKLRSEKRGFLIVTHYQRLLNHIRPDKVHVMVAGKIVKSGGYDLVEQLEQEGYDQWQ